MAEQTESEILDIQNENKIDFTRINPNFPLLKIPHQNFRNYKLPQRPTLESSLVNEIKEVFELFSKTDKINPHDMKDGLRMVKFHKKHPGIYKHIEELCLNYDITGNSLSFKEFIDFLNEHLGDNSTRHGVSHVFEKLQDEKIKEITPESLYKVISEIELDNKLSLQDIKYLLTRISDPSLDIDITSDEFYYIMTKKPSDVDLINPVTKKIN